MGHRFKDDQRALSEKRVYEQSFLQAFNLWPHYPAIAEFVQCRRFADAARRMMGVEGVKLWFDQALYKEPGGRITDYHVDAAFWPVQPAAKTFRAIGEQGAWRSGGVSRSRRHRPAGEQSRGLTEAVAGLR